MGMFDLAERLVALSFRKNIGIVGHLSIRFVEPETSEPQSHGLHHE